jgi:hypothetical protein
VGDGATRVSGGERLEIRSYRDVFSLERRIYRIDTVRLNPGGIPMRGVAYFAVLLAAVLLLASLPVTGWLLAMLPWYLRDVLLSLGGAALFALVRVEGRAFHLAAYALLRHATDGRDVCGLRARRALPVGRRWAPPELVLIADGSDARLRRLRFTGPGAVLVALPHSCTRRSGISRSGTPRLRVCGLPSRRPLASARAIVLARRARVDVHPA